MNGHILDAAIPVYERNSLDQYGRAGGHGLHDPPSVGHCQSDAAVGARADAQHIGLLDVAALGICGDRVAISQILWIPFILDISSISVVLVSTQSPVWHRLQPGELSKAAQTN